MNFELTVPSWLSESLPPIALRVGNTPMRQLTLTVNGRPRTLYLKLEGANPFGSIKDRTACALLQAVRRTHGLQPGAILVESTSGNMGVSLAALCPAFGYRFEAVVDPKTPKGCVERMRTLGAVVHTVSGADEMGNYLQSRLALVRELCAHGRRTWVDQYSNPANPLAHYSTTAPEVLQQMQGRLDAVFIAVGTGGTLAGVARYMRESSPSTVVVAVDTPGSVIFGGPPAPRRLSGIGSARPSDFIEPRLYDRVAMVSDHIAFSFCRRVERSCGFRLGGSSAAAVLAAAEYAAQHPAADRMVVICADDGRDYATSIFDDAWLANQSVPIDLTEPAYISDVLYFRSPIKFGTDLPLDPPTLLP